MRKLLDDLEAIQANDQEGEEMGSSEFHDSKRRAGTLAGMALRVLRARRFLTIIGFGTTESGPICQLSLP